jgi:hypothetical protein
VPARRHDGGTGHAAIGQRAFIVPVLMLQVGDRKVLGRG